MFIIWVRCRSVSRFSPSTVHHRPYFTFQHQWEHFALDHSFYLGPQMSVETLKELSGAKHSPFISNFKAWNQLDVLLHYQLLPPPVVWWHSNLTIIDSLTALLKLCTQYKRPVEVYLHRQWTTTAPVQFKWPEEAHLHIWSRRRKDFTVV